MAKEHLVPEAERLFVQKELNLKEISKILGVSQQTLVKWRRKYEWDKKREEFKRNPQTILETIEKVLHHKLQEISEKIDRGEEISEGVIDSITKLVSSMKKVSKEADIIGATPVVLKEFAHFLKMNEKRENFKEAIRIFQEILPEFYNYMWSKYRR